MLLLFSIIYLCESGFVSYNLTKMTYGNRLNGEADMRLQLSLLSQVLNREKSQYYFPY